MNIEKDTKKWIVKLRRYAERKGVDKISKHAMDTLEAIKHFPIQTALRKYCKTRRFNEDQ